MTYESDDESGYGGYGGGYEYHYGYHDDEASGDDRSDSELTDILAEATIQ